MNTPNAGAGIEELPVRRVPKAGYSTKAWRERTLKQDDAPVKCGRTRQVVEALPEPGEPS
jgi:hypothetical protein